MPPPHSFDDFGSGDGVNDFVMIYQNDDIAGTFRREEELYPNWDMLVVVPVDLNSVGIMDDGDQEASIPGIFNIKQN